MTQDVYLHLHKNNQLIKQSELQTYCEGCRRYIFKSNFLLGINTVFRFLADRFVTGVCPNCGFDVSTLRFFSNLSLNQNRTREAISVINALAPSILRFLSSIHDVTSTVHTKSYRNPPPTCMSSWMRYNLKQKSGLKGHIKRGSGVPTVWSIQTER